MSVREFPGDEFAFEVGQVVTRRDIAREYGTAGQSGIEAPKVGNNIFVHSSPDRGRHHNYFSDGPADESYDRFSYTGDGQSGDQEFRRGNKAIFATLTTNRVIRLFVNTGTEKLSVTQKFEYKGAYQLDPLDTFHYAPGTGADGKPRREIVFHLERIATTLGDEAPDMTTELRTLDAQVSTTTSADEVPAELGRASEFTRSAISERSAQRAERALESRFIAATVAADHSALRYRISIAGEPGYLFTDTWIPETRELVEAKQSASRAHIRVAIGQLLDYARFIEPRPTTLTVLTPEMPRPDLLDFIHSQGMTSAFFDGDKLVRLTP